MERRTNYLEATNTSDLYFKHNHVAWRCFGVSKAIDLQTVIADTAGRHVYSNNDNDAQKRDRADPNYHGKVNRMLYLFLVQASGDAFSEVHFKQGRTQDLELGGAQRQRVGKGVVCKFRDMKLQNNKDLPQNAFQSRKNGACARAAAAL